MLVWPTQRWQQNWLDAYKTKTTSAAKLLDLLNARPTNMTSAAKLWDLFNACPTNAKIRSKKL